MTANQIQNYINQYAKAAASPALDRRLFATLEDQKAWFCEKLAFWQRRGRMEYLRNELRLERISWGELYELQTLAPYISPGDVELLEAAGAPEYPESEVA